MNRQYLLHYDSDVSEIQFRICFSDGVFVRHDGVIIDKTTVPNSFTQRDEWLIWRNKWKQYFAQKYHVDVNKIQ